MAFHTDGNPLHTAQINVPRQCDGLTGKIIPTVHQRCQLRQFLGAADGILCSTAIAIPSRDKIILRAVVQSDVGFLSGKYIFQCAVVTQLGRSFGHNFIRGGLDINNGVIGIILRGQFQSDFLIGAGILGAQRFIAAAGILALAGCFSRFALAGLGSRSGNDDLHIISGIFIPLLQCHRALGNHGGISAFALLSIGFIGRRVDIVLTLAGVLVLVTGVGRLFIPAVLGVLVFVVLALVVPAGVSVSRVRVALDDGRAAAIHHLRGKGRGSHQRQREYHAHQQAHDAPGQIACPFLHVICLLSLLNVSI